MLTNLKDTKKVVGIKQARRAINNGEIQTVYIAEDAEPKVVQDIIHLCNEKSIEIIYASSMKELGKACGIDVSAAVAAILK
ncbi:ribosomal L7Ae/L30e/S12e/Gadd45 family protein [Proteiniborus sp. MB09-C3]|uniref:ribosomal L7Ae/L30e/S12e/Gadd45 family protein n=1 Tax=Proteiniborus sp. MB09-C3 TaxID=3050072 RepID=UPI002556939E|nr:ribosomal L7Ae/L30e/S12e/Gadd45 family protein [Proteiniborus sp. MB09-C3]WIV13145.1 ribosomal L7Ae/L30e/S12e/Gadd45 family protein [Proteiniborus sp. MB09-C3]